MSYSFSFRAETKESAKEKAAEEFGRVLTSQPVHEADLPQAQATTEAFIDMVRDDESMDLSVVVSGSCWGVDGGLNSVGVNVSVTLATKI